MAIKSNPVYIRAYMCRAQAYRNIHDVIKLKLLNFKITLLINHSKIKAQTRVS